MPWKIVNLSFAYSKYILLWLFASIFLAGCASKPWLEQLGSTETEAALQRIDTLAEQNALCGRTLEGDLDLFYQTPLEKRALSGFLRFSMPSSYKFVVSNPFGQPVFAVAGDQNSFQAINTLNKNYLVGDLSSFGLRNSIPEDFLKGNWGLMFTGRNQFSSKAIADIRNDREGRGIWLTLPNPEQKGTYHLLLDLHQEVILACILEDEKNNEIAEIRYADWVTIDRCRQPLNISVSGLDYGTKIQIKLSNVAISDEKKTYHLPPPPGFRRQYMP